MSTKWLVLLQFIVLSVNFCFTEAAETFDIKRTRNFQNHGIEHKDKERNHDLVENNNLDRTCARILNYSAPMINSSAAFKSLAVRILSRFIISEQQLNLLIFRIIRVDLLFH